MKERWFANYERALADREFSGLPPKVAERMAAKDALEMMVPDWSEDDDVPVNADGEENE